ncbi:MAG: hypothetical protein AB7I30_14855, partial [Isosphaeraceae bacterium]
MNTSARRRPDVLFWVVLVLGLILTVGLFSGYRPWGPSSANIVFLFGPIMLAAAAASHSARVGEATKSGREGAPAGRVV